MSFTALVKVPKRYHSDLKLHQAWEKSFGVKNASELQTFFNQRASDDEVKKELVNGFNKLVLLFHAPYLNFVFELARKDQINDKNREYLANLLRFTLKDLYSCYTDDEFEHLLNGKVRSGDGNETGHVLSLIEAIKVLTPPINASDSGSDEKLPDDKSTDSGVAEQIKAIEADIKKEIIRAFQQDLPRGLKIIIDGKKYTFEGEDLEENYKRFVGCLTKHKLPKEAVSYIICAASQEGLSDMASPIEWGISKLAHTEPNTDDVFTYVMGKKRGDNEKLKREVKIQTNTGSIEISNETTSYYTAKFAVKFLYQPQQEAEQGLDPNDPLDLEVGQLPMQVAPANPWIPTEHVNFGFDRHCIAEIRKLFQNNHVEWMNTLADRESWLQFQKKQYNQGLSTSIRSAKEYRTIIDLRYKQYVPLLTRIFRWINFHIIGRLFNTKLRKDVNLIGEDKLKLVEYLTYLNPSKFDYFEFMMVQRYNIILKIFTNDDFSLSTIRQVMQFTNKVKLGKIELADDSPVLLAAYRKLYRFVKRNVHGFNLNIQRYSDNDVKKLSSTMLNAPTYIQNQLEQEFKQPYWQVMLAKFPTKFFTEIVVAQSHKLRQELITNAKQYSQKSKLVAEAFKVNSELRMLSLPTGQSSLSTSTMSKRLSVVSDAEEQKKDTSPQSPRRTRSLPGELAAPPASPVQLKGDDTATNHSESPSAPTPGCR
jgi:hypothetical protein